MKNIEIVNLNEALKRVPFKSIVSGKFQYAIGRNRIKLARQVEILAKIREELAPEGYKELLEEIRGIVKEAITGKPEAEFAAIERKCIEEWAKNAEWVKITTHYDKAIHELYEQESALGLYTIDEELINSLELNEEQVAVILLLNEYAETLAV